MAVARWHSELTEPVSRLRVHAQPAHGVQSDEAGARLTATAAHLERHRLVRVASIGCLSSVIMVVPPTACGDTPMASQNELLPKPRPRQGPSNHCCNGKTTGDCPRAFDFNADSSRSKPCAFSASKSAVSFDDALGCRGLHKVRIRDTERGSRIPRGPHAGHRDETTTGPFEQQHE